MPHLITSSKGTPHVTSANAAAINAAKYGDGQYVFAYGSNLAATMIDSNTMRILPGAACANGYDWAIDTAYEEVTIENGTPGMTRVDLVVAHVETAPVEKIELRVLRGAEVASSGTPVVPTWVEGNLAKGDTVTEQPLWKVTLNGVSVGTPEAMFEVAQSMQAAWDSIYHAYQTTVVNGTATNAVTFSSVAGYSCVSAWLEVISGSGSPQLEPPIQLTNGNVSVRVRSTTSAVSMNLKVGTLWMRL